MIQSAKKMTPIVPYLKLRGEDPNDAVLIGSRCGGCAEVYLGVRTICVRCHGELLQEIQLSRTGELFTYTIVHQSAPWVKVPYVAAVVKLPEGPLVTATLVDVDVSPTSLSPGMSLSMVTEIVRQDADGSDVIAYKFKPSLARQP